MVYEQFKENPFWQDFYADPVRYAFETEITFLLQHYSQYRDATEQAEVVVCDASLLLDLAYADVNLTGSKFEAFKAVYDEATRTLGAPELVIHLRCGADEELARIRARGRDEESGVTTDYLKALNDAVGRRVAEVSRETRVLEIDSERLNFADVPEDKRAVVDMVETALEGMA